METEKSGSGEKPARSRKKAGGNQADKPAQAPGRNETAEDRGEVPARPGSDSHSDGSSPAPFPVIGIGASAGGLEAMQELLDAMPADTGAAFVVVSHQHPDHISLLPELLGRHTNMPVQNAANGAQLEPDNVYVSTGNPLTLAQMRLSVHSLSQDEERPVTPIDLFFRSMAENCGELAVCIVLSGTGADGTLGLKAVKGRGGLAIVQEAASARYSGMPASAIATEMADFVLKPADMPARIDAYLSNLTTLRKSQRPHEEMEKKDRPMQEVFKILRTQTGHDFAEYKLTTLRRRIERRMSVHQIKKLDGYVRFLRENRHEAAALVKEFLIGVTSFFRDREAFEALSSGPLAELLAARPDGALIRAWIVGCGSGEEAYSVAITLYEAAEKLRKNFDFHVFSTDLDQEAIESARTGRYPLGIANDVPTDKLKRWFEKHESTYQIRKEIRDMVVFASQNVISDPPFTRLDMIVCRNVLIYMNNSLQKRVLPMFQYALKPDGLLMLGPSETVGTQDDLFKVLDKKHKIYRRGKARTELPNLPSMGHRSAAATEGRKGDAPGHGQLDAVSRSLLVDRFAPPCVIVNTDGSPVYVHGRTGIYLEPARGRQPGHILDMAREGLRERLGPVLRQARAEKEVIVRRAVRVKTNGEWQRVDLSVVKLYEPEALAGHLLITFTPTALQPASDNDEDGADPDDQRVTDLKRDLQYTKESLQSTVEELETSNEELKSTNEELQSTNEELQSTNEELETSKEEMQSLNEELTTVNTELQAKVDELAEANNDIQNLLNSTDIATVFLDERLRVKRYTQRARDVINLIDTDIGRPLGDLAVNLDDESIVGAAERVLDTLQECEQEVRTKQDNWYLMRVKPYRTTENVIEGVAITFMPIGRFKDRERNAEAEWAFYENIFDTVREPLLILDEDLKVAAANARFYTAFQLSPKTVEGAGVYELSKEQWNVPELRKLLEQVLSEDKAFEDYELEAEFSRAGRRRLLLNARRLKRAPDMPAKILLAMEDVTDT